MNNWNLSLTVYFHRYELNKEYPKVPFNALKQSKIKQGIFINEKSLTKALFSLSDKSDTLPRRGKKLLNNTIDKSFTRIHTELQTVCVNFFSTMVPYK